MLFGYLQLSITMTVKWLEFENKTNIYVDK